MKSYEDFKAQRQVGTKPRRHNGTEGLKEEERVAKLRRYDGKKAERNGGTKGHWG